MAQMQELKQQIIHFPHQPGCYLFKDTAGVVLYVGKAKDLRKRVSQYFGQDKRPQLPFLIEDATDIDYIVARSELEALFLENTLIKKHNPKYNIKLKDDKNYAFIAINYSTEIPQIGYVRKITDSSDFTPFVNPSASWGSGKRESKVFRSKVATSPSLSLREGFGTKQSQSKIEIATSKTPRNDNIRSSLVDSHDIRRLESRAQRADYFGPYSSTKKIRETLDFVRKIFPYCANTEVSNRPCFYYHLHRCPGVCIGAISTEEYAKSLARIKLFLNGKTTEIKKELKTSMQKASQAKKFELAGHMRDQLKALEVLDERQLAQFASKVDYDFISLAKQESLYCVNLFKIRDGKLTDKENFVYTNPNLQHPDVISAPEPGSSLTKLWIPAREDLAGMTSMDRITQTFCETYYTDTTDIPDKVFVQYPLTETALISQLLATRKGKKVPIALPVRGKAKQLIKLGTVNAEEYLRKTLASDATDIDKLQTALQKLQQLLKLPKLPRRIECYDMSNTQGTNPVGSMVVFIDGKPAKSEYRKFKIRSKDTPDDFAMMRETLARRLARLPNPKIRMDESTNNEDPDSSLAPHSSGLISWPTPDLIVIDGGRGQLSAALEAQESFLEASNYPSAPSSGSKDKLKAVPMIGLAKRIEEIFVPNNPEPIILSHDEPALQLLQRLRDEAHRFGITFHRNLRSKQATKSALDTLPGIGPKTKKLLKQKFGTVTSIKNTTLEELAKVVGKAKAKIIKKHL